MAAVTDAAAPRQAACGTCRHVDARNPADVFCRRYPATVVVMRGKGRSEDSVRLFYPNVHPVLDWCGEHSESS